MDHVQHIRSSTASILIEEWLWRATGIEGWAEPHMRDQSRIRAAEDSESDAKAGYEEAAWRMVGLATKMACGSFSSFIRCFLRKCGKACGSFQFIRALFSQTMRAGEFFSCVHALHCNHKKGKHK
jgi:hypothetical protein